MPSELVTRVRTKYPGVYDDLDDAALESAVIAKYPEYQDLVESKPDFRTEVRASDAPGWMEQTGGTVGDLGLGVLKGAGQTAANLGRGVHLIPGVSQAVDWLYGAPVSQASFGEADRLLAPTSTAQAIGKGAEQLGEFFIPGAAIAKAAKGSRVARAGLEALTGAGVAAAQGASPTEIAASGALAGAPTALAPVSRRLTATMAEQLRAKAAKRVTEGLGATTKRLKSEAQRIAPEFAERGLTGSLETLAEESAGNVAGLGHRIGQVIKGPVGQETRATAPIVAQLEKAKTKLTTQAVQGGTRIVQDKPQYEALARLQEVVTEYGDEMSVQQINALKKLYARVTSRSGGYNERAGEVLQTAPEAAKTFAAILRAEENGVAALAELNKEFRFWKGLQTVTKATVDRRSSQGKGLTASMAPVIGAAGGFGSGDSAADRIQNAIIGGVAGRQLTKALQAPQWKFVRAKYASSLAGALAQKDPERVGQVVGKILAAEAAHAY